MSNLSRIRPIPGERFESLCKWIAILAGFALMLMAVSTVISVFGRYFFSSPITGDSEIVQMLTGAVVALSLPYCQMRYGHVIVDVFTESAPLHIKGTLDIIGSLLLGAFAFLLAWQTLLGTIDVYGYRNETMMLRLKEWWFYAIIAFGLFMLGIASLVVAWRHVDKIRHAGQSEGAL